MKTTEPRDMKTLSVEEKARCLDFARRLIFTVYGRLTDARKAKLWGDAEWFLADCMEEGHSGWETGAPDDSFCACDWFSERFEHYIPNTRRWDTRMENGDDPTYYRLLSATCRAALDIVDETPGAGVIGYTVAEMKAMYDGTIPPWLNNGVGWVPAFGEGEAAGVLMETLPDGTVLII